ncbi:MAG: zinc-binding dehydrogenase [Planctomycetaceae bacterium]|nr:zinc-binding dehydrogenase [Planctomycetaceae bacterium]
MKRRVAVQTAPRTIEIVEEELPPLGENDVLVEVAAIGLCHSDMPQYLGERAMGTDAKGRRAMVDKPSWPRYLGHEPVGTILEVGKNVSRFRPGDFVGGAWCGFASHGIADERRCIPVPADITPLVHCLPEPLACIANIVQIANPALGDYVAVIGCGCMGLMTIAGFGWSGAAEIIAIDLLDSRLELARQYGATVTINPGREDVDEVVYEVTKQRGVDVVVEISGSLKGLRTAAMIVRYADMFDSSGRGKILMPSLYGREEKWDPFTGYALMFRAPVLHSAHPWYCVEYMHTARAGVEAYRKGLLPLQRMITHEFVLEDVAKGFELMESRDESYLKGIVIP